MKKVIAIASGGGHWIQLNRLAPAFEGLQVTWVSTSPSYRDYRHERFLSVPDANVNEKMRLAVVFLKCIYLAATVRPNIVVTTGAAPGLLMLLAGRLVGAQTLWVDSIANSEDLSSSGKIARKFAHRCVSQWPTVAEKYNLECWGGVI
jgi:UDP-N-acetylglucosamine:LPS N-acetylglucosamine transferase